MAELPAAGIGGGGGGHSPPLLRERKERETRRETWTGCPCSRWSLQPRNAPLTGMEPATLQSATGSGHGWRSLIFQFILCVIFFLQA